MADLGFVKGGFNERISARENKPTDPVQCNLGRFQWAHKLPAVKLKNTPTSGAKSCVFLQSSLSECSTVQAKLTAESLHSWYFLNLHLAK